MESDWIPEALKERLEQRLIVQGREVATDSRLLLFRWPLAGGPRNDDDGGSSRMLRSVKELFAQLEAVSCGVEPLVWPPAEQLPPPVVHERKQVRCEDCGGVGSSQCPHCDRDMECEQCDGNGVVWRDVSSRKEEVWCWKCEPLGEFRIYESDARPLMESGAKLYPVKAPRGSGAPMFTARIEHTEFSGYVAAMADTNASGVVVRQCDSGPQD